MDNFSEILKKYNYTPEAHSVGGATPNKKTTDERLASLRQATGSQPAPRAGFAGLLEGQDPSRGFSGFAEGV